MEKKKVLFVIHQLNYGGVQKALLSVLNAVDYDRYDVTLYVRKARLDLLPEINPKVSEIIINDDGTHYYQKPFSIVITTAIKVFKILGLKNGAEKLKGNLARYIAEQKIKYEKKRFFSDGKIFDTAVSYIQGYPAKLVAEGVNAKHKVMFFHGSTDENHKLHESVFDYLDVIVGVNEGVQKVLKGLYPKWKEKMTFLTNYVDANEVRKKATKEIVEISEGKSVLCTCGRLNPVKGFDLAVKAAKIMKDAGAKFMWYFVGDGSERGKLEKMIQEYGLEENITITGMQSNPYPWINACDIYVQPSYEEAYGLTIAEAQILCKPVVSTATVGGKYLIKENMNGRMADINEKALADTVIGLVCDFEARESMQKYLRQIDYSGCFQIYKDRMNYLLDGNG